MFSAVRRSDAATVSAYLARTARHRGSLDLLSAAIDAGEPGTLGLLAAHKQPLVLRSADQSSCWGRALASNNVRHLSLLVELGAYDSVARLPGYGGAEFMPRRGAVLPA
ncbi:hypothetical protein [Massilia timonae]|uniref:hypothetical protein n=1 Tax=Massilia timonae TaxID=47229 RepID=UPI00289AFD13|nr:hypothetical protein [Massilia timonae]